MLAMHKLDIDFENDHVTERWHVRNLMGSGAYGKVYSVTDRSRSNTFAVMKFACPRKDHSEAKHKAAIALVEERKIISALNLRAPALNIPKVLDDGVHKGFPYYVMNGFGKSISQLWKESKHKFTLCIILKITYDVLKILKDLHSNGVVHHDIHAGNIVLGGAGQEKNTVFLIDFGRSRPLTPAMQRYDVTCMLALVTRMLSNDEMFSLSSLPLLVSKWAEEKHGMRSGKRYWLMHNIDTLVDEVWDSYRPNYDRMMALLTSAMQVVDEKFENGFDWD
ncbi:serine/threonine protein kinase [Gracilaria domingensis]|nr:serine/threonine protein kinase [Gracilaria domingensis]